MRIDKIYILNVKSQTKRLALTNDALLGQGVPASKIEVFEATDRADFSGVQAIVADGIENGFAYFQALLENDFIKNCYVGYLANAYSYLRFWKHIQVAEENALLIHDDMMIHCTWQELQTACNELDDYAKLCVFSVGPEFQFAELWTGQTPLIQGLKTGSPHDFAILYSHKCAKEMLEVLHLDALSETGWMGESIWNKYKNNNDAWTMFINPTAENLERLSEIKSNLMQNITEIDYMTCGGVPGIEESYLHEDDWREKIGV